MSRLSLTVLKHLPAGYWLIVVWCALQALPLVVVSTRLDGHAADAAILAAVIQLALAAGMLMRLRWVRLLLIACLAASLFVGTIVVAVLGLLYSYVGLAQVETLIAGAIVVYFLFLVWAFFYLFHPNLTEVFEWNWEGTHAERRVRATELAPAA